MESTFNLENFDIKLDTEEIGRNIIYVDEISSTNSFLIDPELSGNVHGTIIIAEKQAKGRGRKERQWYSTKGLNLTFSILLTDKKYFTKRLNLINFAAALAVAIAVENLFQLKTELKWPNDILIKKKKVAGVLIDSSSKGEKIERVVIGIGININQTQFQGNFNIPPTSLKTETGQTVNREILLSEFLNVFEEILEQVVTNHEWLIKEWKERCRMIGEKISIADGKSTKYGIFEDIDENGFLLLKNKGVTEKIYYGDVSSD